METPASILNHLREIKEKGSEAEIKLEKISPDEEAEEIRKELDKIVSDEKILEKPKPLPDIKKIKIPEIKGSDSTFWLLCAIGMIVLIVMGLAFLSEGDSSQVSAFEQPARPKTRDFDIGGGKIIQIPI